VNMSTEVYIVEWMGFVNYVRAVSKDRAKMRIMRSAREAGCWSPGKSLSGLRVCLASYVPSDAVILEDSR
jgi:hypothetical protein